METKKAEANEARRETQKGRPKQPAASRDAAGSTPAAQPRKKRNTKRAREEVAEAAGVGVKTAERVLKAYDESPEVFEEVKRGETSAREAERKIKAQKPDAPTDPKQRVEITLRASTLAKLDAYAEKCGTSRGDAVALLVESIA